MAKPKWVSVSLRLVAAVLTSLVVSLVVFVLINAIPVWTMMLIYGREEILSAPASGGGMLFLTLPIALMAGGLLFFVLLVAVFDWSERLTWLR